MKRTLIIFFVMIFAYMGIGNVIVSKDIIPDDAIRIRIIANSNSEYDQSIKMKVKEIVEDDMYNLLRNTKKITEAREIIKENISNVEYDIDRLLKQQQYKLPFTINFGLNYFPKKEYKGISYKEGYYESVVVTLGEGLGDNWWCILFPPLCLIEAEESTDVEYTTFVKTILNKYF